MTRRSLSVSALCTSCERRFDDWTDTIFAGHHQPLRIWMLGLYCMGLNLSNAPMAEERDLHPSDVHERTSQWRPGMVPRKPTPVVSDEVEGDEVYSVAGHKGKPEEVVKKGGAADVDGLKESVAEGHSKRRNRRSSA